MRPTRLTYVLAAITAALVGITCYVGNASHVASRSASLATSYAVPPVSPGDPAGSVSLPLDAQRRYFRPKGQSVAPQVTPSPTPALPSDDPSQSTPSPTPQPIPPPSTSAPTPTPSPTTSPLPAPAPVGAAQQTAEDMLASYGWSVSAQFGCLVSLWNEESGWNVYATNPSSGAYGIPQALPADKMASAGPDWQTDAATQITWGLGYIQSVYGSPCAAWAHEQADGWY